MCVCVCVWVWVCVGVIRMSRHLQVYIYVIYTCTVVQSINTPCHEYRNDTADEMTKGTDKENGVTTSRMYNVQCHITIYTLSIRDSRI